MLDLLRRAFGLAQPDDRVGPDPRAAAALAGDEERRAYPDMLLRDQMQRDQQALARARGYPSVDAMVAQEPGLVPFPIPDHRPLTPVFDPALGRMVLRDPNALGEPLTLDETLRSLQTWVDPLDNPSRVMGAAITGQNPLRVWDSTLAEGERPPTLGRALVDYGAPEWLGLASELLVVPDPTFAGNLRDMFLIASIIPGFRRLGKLVEGTPDELRRLIGKDIPEGRFGDIEDLSRFPELQDPETLEKAAEEIAQHAREVRARGQELGIDVEPVVNRVEAAAARAQLQADVLRYREGRPVIELQPTDSVDGVLDQLADIGLNGGVIPNDFPTRAQAVEAIRGELQWLNDNVQDVIVPADDPRVHRLILALQSLGDERSVMLQDIPMHQGADPARFRDDGGYYRFDDIVNSPIHNSIYNESEALRLFARAGMQAENMKHIPDEIVTDLAPKIRDMWGQLSRQSREQLQTLITEQAYPGNLAYAALDRPAIELQSQIEQFVREGSDMATSRMLLLDVMPPPPGVQQALDDLYAKGLPTKDAIELMQDADPAVRNRGAQALAERLREAGYSNDRAAQVADEALNHYRPVRETPPTRAEFEAESAANVELEGVGGGVPPAVGDNGMREWLDSMWARIESNYGFDKDQFRNLPPDQQDIYFDDLDLSADARRELLKDLRTPESGSSETFTIPVSPEEREFFRETLEAGREARNPENWTPVELMDAIEERWGSPLDGFFAHSSGEDFKRVVASELRLMGVGDDKADELAEGIYVELGGIPKNQGGGPGTRIREVDPATEFDDNPMPPEMRSIYEKFDADNPDRPRHSFLRSARGEWAFMQPHDLTYLAIGQGLDQNEVVALLLDIYGRGYPGTTLFDPGMSRDEAIGLYKRVSRNLPPGDIAPGYIAPGVKRYHSAFRHVTPERRAELREHLAESPRSLSGGFVGDAQLDEVINLPGARGEHIRIPGNAEEQARIDELARDMESNGWQGGPIMIWVEQDGTVVIAEGNHRVRAAQQAGLETIPIDVRYYGGSDGNPDTWRPRALRRYLGEDE